MNGRRACLKLQNLPSEDAGARSFCFVLFKIPALSVMVGDFPSARNPFGIFKTERR